MKRKSNPIGNGWKTDNKPIIYTYIYIYVNLWSTVSHSILWFMFIGSLVLFICKHNHYFRPSIPVDCYTPSVDDHIPCLWKPPVSS